MNRTPRGAAPLRNAATIHSSLTTTEQRPEERRPSLAHSPSPLLIDQMAHQPPLVELVVEKDTLASQHHKAAPDVASPFAIPPSPKGRRSRRTKWAPPKSLQDHFERKRYLSVTELTSPSWCEYNYQYSVLGALSTLPASQRPAAITTPDGATLQPSLTLLEQKERVLDKGKAVHAQLEWEAQPGEAIRLETTTSEDIWAARLLDMWSKLEWLNKGGAAREFELCGWVEGHFVRGVVDEIVRKPLGAGAVPGGSDRDRAEAAKEKVWASQEEWKRNQQRRKAKKVKASDVGGEREIGKLKTAQLDLFGFTSPVEAKKQDGEGDTKAVALGSQSQPASSAAVSSRPSPPASADVGTDATLTRQEPFGDSQPYVPQPDVEAAGWGYFLSDTKTRVSPFLPAEEDQMQARRQCMIYKRLFDGVCLGALASQRPPTRSPPSKIAAAFDPHATPLNWIETLISLELSPFDALSSGFLASAIPLAESWGCDILALPFLRTVRTNEGGEAIAEGCTLSDLVTLLETRLCTFVNDAVAAAGTIAIPTPSDAHPSASASHSATEVIQSTLTLSYIHQPRTLTRAPSRSSTKAKRSSRPPARSLGDVAFRHDSELLQAFLVDALELWKGKRELRGVKVEETKRCWHCVWKEGCEWRDKMAGESAKRFEVKTPRTPPKTVSAVNTRKEQEEGEEDLWKQFSDIDADDLMDI